MKRDPVSGKKNKDYKKFILFKETADVRAASEPSNVVWENLEVDKKTTRKRYSVVFSIIIVFIVVTFLMFTAMKYLAGQNKLVYPISTNCGDITNNFRDKTTNEIDQNLFEQYAQDDKNPTLDRRGSGMYQCFCK